MGKRCHGSGEKDLYLCVCACVCVYSFSLCYGIGRLQIVAFHRLTTVRGSTVNLEVRKHMTKDNVKAKCSVSLTGSTSRKPLGAHKFVRSGHRLQETETNGSSESGRKSCEEPLLNQSASFWTFGKNKITD